MHAGSILTIFDFDDTLVRSHASKIRVTHSSGHKTELSSAEYARYAKQPGDELDYSDFDKYPHGAEPINETFRAMRKAQLAGHRIVVLTARSRWMPVKRYLATHGFKSVHIVAIGDSDPWAKAKWVIDEVKENDYDLVQVYEDNVKNIRAIKKVVGKNGISFRSFRVGEDGTHTVLESHRRPGFSDGAGIFVVRTFDDGIKVLLLMTPYGRWDIPKGHLDPGEGLFQCAVRETYEEAGIKDLSFTWGQEPIAELGNLTLYIAETSQSPTILANPETGEYEHVSARWVPISQAVHLVPAYLKSGAMALTNILF
jgi:8-oxo-dGTP pyrophosphatase MutT (NUDIX family)